MDDGIRNGPRPRPQGARRHRYPRPPSACPAQAAIAFDREAPIHAADLLRIRMQV
jgi:hypothetical protein